MRPEVVISRRRRQARTLLVGLVAALVAAAPAAGDPISSKRAQARQVLEQIHEMDVQLEKAIEAYNLANVRLAQIQRELRINKQDRAIARRNLRTAQRRLGARLRAIYVAGEEDSTLELILGAKSLDDLLNRIDTVNRVSDQDAEVLREIKIFKREMQRRSVELRRASAEQKRIVAERAATKRTIASGLAARQRLLSSIRGEIARLEAAEQRRQARLEAQARARLVQQRARQQEALEERPQDAVEEPVVGASAITPEGETVAPPSQYGGVVAIAMQYLGTPYVWGGASPGGFDCSGFIMYVYAQVGVSLPHNAAAQFGYGTPVSSDELEPGDLVFFDGLGHDGIYIGGGQFIHSPHTGDVVKISGMGEAWYASTYVGARRL